MTGLSILPLQGMPLFAPGMSVAAELLSALGRMGEAVEPGDVLVVAQKIVSKAEGRALDFARSDVSEEALALSRESNKLPEICQIIMDESAEILRATPAAVIACHKTGHVLANAGIDSSNVAGGEAGTVLLWPEDPDVSARAIRTELSRLCGARPAVVIADSLGRAWRIGTVGAAIGCAGLTVLDDRRGKDRDLFGRTLQATVIAVADAVAAAAVLAMGEGAEGTPAALVRGAGKWVCGDDGPGAVSGIRPIAEDMFR